MFTPPSLPLHCLYVWNTPFRYRGKEKILKTMYRSEIACIAVGPDGAGFGRPPPISPAGPRSPHKTAAVQTAGSGSLGLLWTAAWEGPVPKASPDHSRTGIRSRTPEAPPDGFRNAPLIEDQVFRQSSTILRFRMHHQLFFSEKRQQKGVLDQVLCLLYAASHAVRQFKHFSYCFS